jgi:hypothetical protein
VFQLFVNIFIKKKYIRKKEEKKNTKQSQFNDVCITNVCGFFITQVNPLRLDSCTFFVYLCTCFISRRGGSGSPIYTWDVPIANN